MKTQIIVSAAVIGVATIVGVLFWTMSKKKKEEKEAKPATKEPSDTPAPSAAGVEEPKPKMRAFRRKMNDFDRSARMRVKPGAEGASSSGPAYKWIQHNLASGLADDPEAKHTPSARYTYGVHDSRGPRDEMEDAMAVKGRFAGNDDQDYYAVFDGHGGRDAAIYCMLHLHPMIAKNLADGNAPEEAITKSFTQIDQDIGPWAEHLGTTALTALILGNKLYSANVGDSRMVLGFADGTAERLSIDHKPSDEEEKIRIEADGGVIQKDRVNNRIAVTRAIGDSFMSKLIIPKPYIRQVDLKDEHKFLILACDGVWDVITDAEAVNMVMKVLIDGDANEAAKTLVNAAIDKGTKDNVSVCVVVLAK